MGAIFTAPTNLRKVKRFPMQRNENIKEGSVLLSYFEVEVDFYVFAICLQFLEFLKHLKLCGELFNYLGLIWRQDPSAFAFGSLFSLPPPTAYRQGSLVA